MALRNPTNGMFAGIYARVRGNRAELADAGVDRIGVVDDVAVIAEFDFSQGRACADFRIAAETAVLHAGGGVDQRLGPEFLHCAAGVKRGPCECGR